jgi:hypothetical protein
MTSTTQCELWNVGGWDLRFYDIVFDVWWNVSITHQLYLHSIARHNTRRLKQLAKKLVLQGYNESRLKSSFCNFYSRCNDLVCDYKLPLAHMLNDLFHTFCSTVISILALTIGNHLYIISTQGAWRVWPVCRGCSLLHGTWSYLRCNNRSE